MKIKLMNAFEDMVEFDVGKIKDINLIVINVVSGDEIMDVYYKNGETKTFDSDRHGRCMSFQDARYVLYQPGVINKLKDKQWQEREYQYYM